MNSGTVLAVGGFLLAGAVVLAIFFAHEIILIVRKLQARRPQATEAGRQSPSANTIGDTGPLGERAGQRDRLTVERMIHFFKDEKAP